MERRGYTLTGEAQGQMGCEEKSLSVDVSIVIAAYGEDDWRELAFERAYPSTFGQDPHEVVAIYERGMTLAQVRNLGAAKATGDWLCFLDADDELGSGYIGAMRRALEQERGVDGAPLLLTPAVSYILRSRAHPPRIASQVPLEFGNWLVIGTLVPRDLFNEVGGFIDHGIGGYEDWSLWTRCHKAGARVVRVPEAIYRAHVNYRSRNRSASYEQRLHWHYKIGRDIWPEYYPQGWMGLND